MDTTEKKVDKQVLEEQIIAGLKNCYDPEIPVDIFELGLIYEIKIDDDFNADILMTLTAPNCPVAESLPVDVQMAVKGIEGLKEVNVEVVLDPPWSIELMSEEAKLDLGFL